MNIEEAAYKMDDLVIQLWKLDGLAQALTDALIYGHNSTESYEGGLSVLTDLTSDLYKDATDITGGLFKTLRSAKRGMEVECG